ncbi:hypothetical protein SAMN04487950_1445 [Halogranum rubrum]|uniref:Uncharacterized protein n=1 Tax=Halogranum rubrum TaxID=553466 RepID=A0A1I4CYX5_9EURY|nr:hypothetical protein [Halogranum rubrum]SFK85417.1 hypothetical protein SAMN04487950_1445 [Halogranum rubrum]
MTTNISLDGRTVVAVENDGGEVGSDTRMTFTQDGSRLSATYSGGDVVEGHLVGTLVDGEWDVRYVQLNREGETATGHSVGSVEEGSDGRVRIEDEWEWESKPGGGRSVLEEVRE